MKRSSIIIIAVAIVVAIGLVMKLRAKSRWLEPEIAVQYLGMTNDAAGTILARFELQNVGEVSAEVWVPGYVDAGPLRGGGYFGSNTIVALRRGSSLETYVAAPAAKDRWRAEFLCFKPLSFMGKIRNFAAGHGIPVARVAAVGCHVYSEFVLPDQSVEENAGKAYQIRP